MTTFKIQSKKIALVGATGNIGSHILTEALARGHFVTGIVRNVQRLAPHPLLTPCQADFNTEQAVKPLDLAGHDLAIVSIKWIDNDVLKVIDRLKHSGIKRVIFVVGAGSLRMPDGRTWFEHNAERGSVPPSSGPAVAAFEVIRRLEDLDWTAISPPATIQSGERTGQFRTGLDELIVDADGNSRISLSDFAIAIVDEAENPKHVRRRFTVAY